MRAAQCDRARFWISLQLDGVLSEFETALLDQHVGRCADCRVFKAEASAHTALLRSAAHEPLAVPVALPERSRPTRRVLTAAGSVAASAAAAVLALHGLTAHPANRSAVRVRTVARPAALAVLAVDASTLGVRRNLRGGQPDGTIVRGTYGQPA
ncbi:MAG TPA: zf-HC2 domain-containing protein [Gaiellaceae bacterium]|nr:zf-HC2 domain-containing protein [Gaiellaceae bacterium]